MIRNYQDSDFENLVNLLKVSNLYSEKVDKRAIYKRKIEYDPDSMIIFEDNGKVVGCIFIVYDPWSSYVYHLGVHPEYKNRGIGSTLLEEAERRLKSRGIEMATAFIGESNDISYQFFTKRGWSSQGKVFDMEKDL